MGTTPVTLTCSTAELVVLAGLSGAETLQGLPNPFRGWLVVEIEEAWDRAEALLIERGWLMVSPDTAPKLSPAIRPVVETCCFPDVTYVTSHTQAGGLAQTWTYHVGKESAVELVAQPGSDQCTLTQLAGLEEVRARIASHLELNGRAERPGEACLLSQESLTEARKIAAESGTEAVQAHLLQEGLPSGAALALASALADPISNSAVMALTHGGTIPVARGFGLLEGHSGLWLLTLQEPQESKMIKLTPMTDTEAHRQWDQLFGDTRPGLVMTR